MVLQRKLVSGWWLLECRPVPPSKPQVSEDIQQCFSTGVPWNLRVPRVRARGSTFWMLVEQEYPACSEGSATFGGFQVLTCVNSDFQPWQQSGIRSENDCCLLKKNFGCVCLKHGPEFKRFAEIVKHKFRTKLLTKLYCDVMLTMTTEWVSRGLTYHSALYRSFQNKCNQLELWFLLLI